jgi:hypothetical protein
MARSANGLVLPIDTPQKPMLYNDSKPYHDSAMPQITLEISEELSAQLNQVGVDRLPELLERSLRQSDVSAQVYRHILDFLASNPTPTEIAAFRPTPEMQERLRVLLDRSKSGSLTPEESQELDDYEQIEHLVIMLKAGNFRHLSQAA